MSKAAPCRMPAAPTTALQSQLYRWHRGRFSLLEEFPTSGGTDVSVHQDEAGTLVAVSNALTHDVRFATDSVLYRFTE